MFLQNVNGVLPDYMAFIIFQSVVLLIVTSTRTSDSGEGIEFECYSKNLCSASVIGNLGHTTAQMVRQPVSHYSGLC